MWLSARSTAMADFLLEVAPFVVRDVVPSDALSVRGTCRRARSLTGASAMAAAAFALTRPSLGAERCTLAAWEQAWAACAAAVEAEGVNVGVWARAAHVHEGASDVEQVAKIQGMCPTLFRQIEMYPAPAVL